MNALGFIFTVGVVVVGGIYLWTFTKKGKNGLETCKIPIFINNYMEYIQ